MLRFLQRTAPILLYAALALAYTIAGWRADPRTWGVHAWAFLPRPLWLAASGALLLLLVPGIAARVGVAAMRLAGACCRSAVVLAATALVSGALFFAARPDFQFLGDGLAWVNALREGRRFHHFEPLSSNLVRFVAMAFDRAQPDRAAGLLAVFLGPCHVWTTGLLCRELWSEAQARWLAWVLLLVHPALLLFCGYVESYPLLLFLQVCFTAAFVRAARGRTTLAWPAGLLGLAISAHLAALMWMPALVAVARRRRSGGAALALLAPLGALATGAASLFLMGDTPVRLVRLAVGGEVGLAGQSWAWMFSARHLIDLVNELVLILGPALVLLTWAFARGWRPRSALADDVWLPIAWLVPGTLLLTCTVEPRIGGVRDWDLFLPLVLPVVLLSVEAWRAVAATSRPSAAGPRREKGPTLRRAAAARPADGPATQRGHDAGWIAAARALGLASVACTGWLALGLDSARSARWFETLVQRSSMLSSHARGYANETLAVYYRDRNPAAARDAWLRATEANPRNPRYFNNLGMEELRLERTDEACLAFRRALELGMDDYFVLFNVGTCERRVGNLASAEGYYDRLLARWPERWEAYSARGLVRVQMGRPDEALLDLQRAATMAPRDADTHYRQGLALHDLGRLDEARAAWQRALQLDPSHRQARSRLQQLDGAKEGGAVEPK